MTKEITRRQFLARTAPAFVLGAVGLAQIDCGGGAKGMGDGERPAVLPSPRIEIHPFWL